MDLTINAEVAGWRVISDLAVEFAGHSYVVTKGGILGRMKVYDPAVYRIADYTALPVSSFIPKLLYSGEYAGDLVSVLEFHSSAVSLMSLGPVQEPAALRILYKLSVLMTSLHDVGLYHGGLHPDSVYWDGENAYLYDFGSAIGATVMRRQTLAPSDFLDIPETGADPVDFMRADVSRLAGLLYYLIYGESPGTIKKAAAFKPSGSLALDTLFSRAFCWLPSDRLNIISFRYYLDRTLADYGISMP